MKPECKRPSTCGSDRAFRALFGMLVTFVIGCTPPAATSRPEARPAETSPAPASTQTPSQATGIVSEAQESGEWPIFRGNSLSNGVAASALTEDPALLWKKSFKDGMFESTPAIETGVVYVGGLNGYFYALDLATGDEKWKFHSELGFRAGRCA